MDSCSVISLLAGRVTGLGFVSFSSLVSLLAVITVLLIIAWKYRRNVRSDPGEPWSLLRSDLDAYMLQLLFGEVIMSVSGVIDAKWAIEQKVYCGTVCQVQGATNVVGVGSVAAFTSAITAHTCMAIWLYFILFVVVGYLVKNNQGQSFFAPAPLWCFIDSQYVIERIFGQYIWIWAAGLGSIFFYTQLFLCARGNLSFNNERYWPWSMRWHFPAQRLPEIRTGSDGKSIDEDVRRVEGIQRRRDLAWTTLMYPASYTVLTVGLSVTRWANVGDNIHLPENSSAAAGALFSRFLLRLSGLVTVVLLTTTRHNMLLFGKERGVLFDNDPRRD
ncbi:unnamed protein product [Rhizoctonia solani]|uniref:Glucose receptor Git3 N-terminal domain-containing protein n=1 Tax=Rhizoctonia solani TaxID=456999 RepID=A0A8H3GAC6_9AGAM|nr:unnamed protein product [Rhizoctonia solani]